MIIATRRQIGSVGMAGLMMASLCLSPYSTENKLNCPVVKVEIETLIPLRDKIRQDAEKIEQQRLEERASQLLVERLYAEQLMKKEQARIDAQYKVKLSDVEKDSLAHLVYAEAEEDGMEGMIGVANVVINRMQSKQYPDDLYSVIEQPYQFEVVSNGSIGRTPSAEAYEAVERALKGENSVGDSLYFWADYLDESNSIWQQNVTTQHGTTVFGR